MYSDPDEIFCPGCASYAHPFLVACPVCGVRRVSLYEAAMAEPNQGLAALASSPRLVQEVPRTVLRYARKGTSPTADNLPEGLGTVAGALAYRVRIGGDTAAGAARGHVEIDETDIVVRERNPSRERVRLALDAILAVSAAARGRRADTWAGLAFEAWRERESPPPLDGDIVVAHATPTGIGRLALANPTGLLAARARSDHYTILTHWIGIVAAGAAERRWTAVGPRRHAHELGLAPAPPGESPASPGTDAPPAIPLTVVDALGVLEELRAAGLVSGDEYAAKRREILDRI
ncbi:MAG TPA: SHOCT domain-containing protein [Patescibacteria group bacterium]|nr:SHOCT domain-containing protein [Patescibacteria group bacterium]